ncbi:enoyl-CoA hydratase/isomerase family protein [Paenibacillus abyssi]|uniref:Enoyl-CoA hydratase n=1 Tax=Paenibacillus abyssi TaxID=1340531 RepID=A0A917FX42_9BACL|nr:enoyl-CoA hydratase/isomerase family protein [Paenibacillus abyssi]GGG11325.1 enoyl-CoA hydratase [Paenibacillus abyssi]
MRVAITRVPDGKITMQQTSKVAIVTINRPAARNAMTRNMWKSLGDIADDIGSNPKMKVVVLKGVPGEFTAGSDIKEFAAMSLEEADEAFHVMERTIAKFEELPIPVIAAIDGPAMGAGLILSLACDLRIGTPQARLGIPVGKLGITLGPLFVRRMVRLMGPSFTKELVMTNRILNADEASSLGLLNRLVASEELERLTFEFVQTIMNQSRGSLQAVKKAVAHSYEVQDQEGAWRYVDPIDFTEGCIAFAQKRKPKFR